MVIVKLMGGLGNQLFQYATAKALSVRQQMELKLDLSFLSTDPKGQHTARQLELPAFNIPIQIATEQETEAFTKPGLVQKLANALSFKKEFIREKGFAFDPQSSFWTGNAYLEGFWQSEKYFSSIRPQLLEELHLKKGLSQNCSEIEQKIKSTTSVSLHIRRGDYVHLKTASEFHGVLPMSYYQEALAYLKEKLGSFTVFVFSDDMNWAKENVKSEMPLVFVDCAPDNATDLYLMSRCHHNIIANSSFSWWGAWLNQHTDKLVVAPGQWFRQKDIDTKDLIPQSWTRIDIND